MNGFTQEDRRIIREILDIIRGGGSFGIGGASEGGRSNGFKEQVADLNDFLSIAKQISEELRTGSGYFYDMSLRSKKLREAFEGISESYNDYNEKIKKYESDVFDAISDRVKIIGGNFSDLSSKLKSELRKLNSASTEEEKKAIENNISTEFLRYTGDVRKWAEELSNADESLVNVKVKVDEISGSLEKASVSAANFGSKIDMIRLGLNSAAAQVKRFGNRWIEFQDRALKNGRAMGKDRAEATAYFERSLQYTRELGRRYGLTHEQIVKFQTDYTEATGKAIDLTKEQTESIAAMGTLSTPETASKMADEMDRFGGSIEDAAFYMQLTQERAKILGLNPKKAAESIAQNMKLASTYTFKNGIDGMARMAIEAQRLRVSMESVVKATESFDDIEKAISNSARIQMLGGSFAANYSNPMGVLYESLNDPEAFMRRMEKTLAGKGVFNRQTGQVDVAAIDRRFIKEYASAAGISFEEAMNMTQSLTKNKEVDAALKANASTANFTSAQTAFIQSQAQWDAESKQFKVTDQTTGEQIALKDLTAEKLQQLQGNTLGEKEMWGDVRDIRDHLLPDIKARQKRRAAETTSTKENIQGFKEATDAMVAKAVHPFMQSFSDLLSADGALGKLADAFTSKQPAWLGALELMIGTVGWNLFRRYFGYNFGDMVVNIFSKTRGGGAAAAANAGRNRFSSWRNPFSRGGGGSQPNAGRQPSPRTPNARAGSVSSFDALRRFTRMNGLGAGLKGAGRNTLRALRTPLKSAGPLGTAIGVGLGLFEGISAISNHSKAISAIEASNMTEEQKAKMKSSANKQRNEQVGGAVGATAGGIIGAAALSWVPIIGTMLGGTVGAWLGDKVGKMAGRLIGDDRTKDQEAKAYAQHNFETEKMGVTGNEPLEDIQYKAAVATIGIHDLMITNYNRAKGLREDGTRKGFWERIDGWFGGDEFANGGIVRPLHAANGAIIPGEHTIGDRVPVWANSDEMILNRNQQSALFNTIKGLSVKGPEIKPLSSIGQATNFSPMQSPWTANNAPTAPSDINLNVSGTIRLEGGGNSANIDVNSLLNSPQFKRQITDLITSRLNESSNGGKKNLESYRNNMAGQYNKVGR